MSTETYKICIVLLNYQTPKMTLDCLETLVPQAKLLPAKIVVVDNHSNDDSVSIISQWICDQELEPLVRLIASDTNGGFAAGNNIGISSETADYYLLINSDTLLRENALAKMLEAILSDKSIGLLSPRLEWPDGTPQESCFRFHHPFSQLIISANTGIILRLFSNYEVAHRVSEKDTECAWTSFACVMVRKEVLDQVGNLDDEFFMYFEDAEFCWRAKAAGWNIFNHPAAQVVHLRGGSSPVKANKAQRKRQARYFYESRTRYFYLLYGHGGLLAANLLWTLGWFFALTRSALQKSFSAPACKSEWRDIWTNFLNPERPYIHPKTYK